MAKINYTPSSEPVYRTHENYGRTPIADPLQRYLKDVRHWSVMERWKQRDAAKSAIAILPINDDIAKLEAGDWNVFFESNVYLYNLQKECHHFAQP